MVSSLLLITLASCAQTNACQETTALCTRVLFIGNSYTYENDLPATFAALAQSGGHAVATGMAANGGWTLQQHNDSADTLKQINDARWSFVVLQEQSQIPSVGDARRTSMYPALRALVSKTRERGATPLLFLTWAHRDGWYEQGLRDYASMQSAITQGYLQIARELQTPVAPVGVAWNIVQRENPKLELWQGDGSHPTKQGTYLAACVFYAVIFRTSPEGLNYHGGLDDNTAQILQATAAHTVLENPAQWLLR